MTHDDPADLATGRPAAGCRARRSSTTARARRGRRARARATPRPTEVAAWAVRSFGPGTSPSPARCGRRPAAPGRAAAPGRGRAVPRHRLPLRRDLGPATWSRQRCSVTIVDVAARQTVAEQDAEYGAAAARARPRPVLPLRKVEPLARALSGYERVGHRRAPGGGADPRRHARSSSGTTSTAWSRSTRSPPGPTRTSRPTPVEHGLPVNPLLSRRLPVDRLRAVHPPGRARRGPSGRPLVRHRQDRMRAAHMSTDLRDVRTACASPVTDPRRPTA